MSIWKCICLVVVLCCMPMAAMADVPQSGAASQAVSTTGPSSDSLLSNSDFSQVGADGWFVDWPHNDDATVQTEGGKHFLELKSPAPGKMVLLYRQMKLPDPAPAGLELRVKVRYDITPGKNLWFDGRFLMHFANAMAKPIKGDPSPPAFHGASKGWVTKSVFFAIPKDAKMLIVMPALFQVNSGTLDIAECGVYPATADQVPKPKPMVYSQTVTPADVKALPPELHVAGNQLAAADGKNVWLQGLCLDSLEWSAAGEHLQQSFPVAIDQWHANVIRLPVSRDMWWGYGHHEKDSGEKYRGIVDGLISMANARGTYVVLDLHRFGVMTSDDVDFWKDAATRYKNDPGVIFELFNEPHSISWKLWRYGGSTATDTTTDANVAENTIASDDDDCVGMQALLDAIRSTGAKNLVVAGGLDWGFDLTGTLNGFALQDSKDGDGVMYSSHIYPWKRDWQKYTLDAAAKYPVFIGEVGCPSDWTQFKFIPPSQQFEKLGPGCTWSPDIIGAIQKYHLNWTAFSFHPRCGPEVISDWNYTPTAAWGVYVKEALAGQQFPSKLR